MNEFKCDVLVVGGGVAGMSAALAAARYGAKTLLPEKRNELGGILRAGLNFPVCGLFDSNANLLNDGISRELFELGAVAPKRMGQVYVWPCPPEKLLALFDQKIAVEKNLSVMSCSEVMAVEERDGRIIGVTFGDGVVRPSAVIDCSGEGVVLQACSTDTMPPSGKVLAGYSIRFDGLGEDPMLPIKVPHALQKAELPDYLQFSSFSGPDCLKMAVPADIEKEVLERDIEELFKVLKNKVTAFENAVIAETSPYVLQREGTRLRGEYVLSKEDVLSGAQFDDAVAKCDWPIEYWEIDEGQLFEYLPDGMFYEVPLRCLKSIEIKNLFVAGRCISTTSEALASARVMGCCIATGEAAGHAAAEQCV